MAMEKIADKCYIEIKEDINILERYISQEEERKQEGDPEENKYKFQQYIYNVTKIMKSKIYDEYQ